MTADCFATVWSMLTRANSEAQRSQSQNPRCPKSGLKELRTDDTQAPMYAPPPGASILARPQQPRSLGETCENQNLSRHMHQNFEELSKLTVDRKGKMEGGVDEVDTKYLDAISRDPHA